ASPSLGLKRDAIPGC
ncbi:hypothetical protein DBR06_SOUSAS1410077, partial [Sousa chinensis]